MIKYNLMHKNIKCGTILFDENIGRITSYHDDKTGLSPYLGNADIKKMQKWWEMRAVPSSRAAMQNVIRAAGCFNTEMYLAKNLGLSMTDTYWIKPEDIELSFDDVKFSNIAIFSHGKVPYHNVTSYDPNASLGGQMEKYWDLMHQNPVLVKESYKHFGQQAINEVFATMLHERQDTKIPFVKYYASRTEDRGIECRCNAFTSEKTELLSAYEIIESQKNRNDQSLYDEYINICVQNGIDREQIQSFMDYQTMTDFLITNTDEHLLNFGVLRDTDDMKLIGPAPIFDSGNSMFFADDRKIPYTRAGILDVPITSFYKNEEKMLSKVKNRDLVNLDLLPTPREVKELYTDAGVPEQKADVISKNFETKLQLFSEFQKGKTISLYKEKKAEKERKYEKPVSVIPKQTFVMICGIPGSGKSRLARELYASSKLIKKDDTQLYPIEKIPSQTGLIFDSSKITDDISVHPEYKDTIVLIAPNKIRQELRDVEKYNEQLVFAVADARIKTALASGASVIYSATNLDKYTREKYINMAKECDVKNTTLHVAWSNPYDAQSDISPNILLAMNNRLSDSNPSMEEGWSEVVTHGKEIKFEIDMPYFDDCEYEL